MAPPKPTKPSREPYVVRSFGGNPDALIVIDHPELMKYRYLVNKVAPDEVQWYSKVRRVILPKSKRSKNTSRDLYVYQISDIFIPEQEVTGASVDTDLSKNPMAMYKLMKDVEDRHPADNDLGFDEEAVNADMQAMHCWCHSHPFSHDPHPSGTDDTQFRDWVEANQIGQNVPTPMVALIFGKGEKIHARVYDPAVPGVYYDKVDVSIRHSEDFDTGYIDDAISDRITKKVFSSYRGAWSNPPPGMIKGPDGTYRYKYYHDRFMKTYKPEEKAPVVSDETKAREFFTKKNKEAEWDGLLKDINTIVNNEKFMKELLTRIDGYLKTDYKMSLFVYAICATGSELKLLVDAEAEDDITLQPADQVAAMCLHYEGDVMSNAQLKVALTFAYRYNAQKHEEGKLRAIYTCIASMDAVDTLAWDDWDDDDDDNWGAAQLPALAKPAEPAAGGESTYGFVDDGTWD